MVTFVIRTSRLKHHGPDGVSCPSNHPWTETDHLGVHFSAFSPVYELMLGTNHTSFYAPYTSNLVAVMEETADLYHDLLPFIKSYTYQAAMTG